MSSSGTLTRIGGALRATFRRERDQHDDEGFLAVLGSFGDDFFGDDHIDEGELGSVYG